MIDINSIQSLTDFKRNTGDYLDKLRKTRRPLVLTINGRAECVVLDTHSYQEMLDQLEHGEVRAIQEGIESAEKYGTRPIDEVLDEVAEKYGLSR